MIRIPASRAPTHPGEMLKEEFLIPMSLTQRELAQRLRVSYPRLNDLIHGRRGMTPDTALRLERLLGVEAQFWLNLQLAWDLYHARRSPQTKTIRRIHPLRRAS
jgi:addiction module HigA family antidote